MHINIINVYLYMNTCICRLHAASVLLHIHVQTHTCIHIYIHNIYIYIYTHTHTCICRLHAASVLVRCRQAAVEMHVLAYLQQGVDEASVRAILKFRTDLDLCSLCEVCSVSLWLWGRGFLRVESVISLMKESCLCCMCRASTEWVVPLLNVSCHGKWTDVTSGKLESPGLKDNSQPA